jgi:UDP-glucose 4-epimerase
LHSPSEIVHVPYEEAYGPGFEDMFRRVPSLAKLERLTGYRPTTTLETIIDAVVSEMRSHAPRYSVNLPDERFLTAVPQSA